MSKQLEFIKALGVPDSVVTALESADDNTDITALLPEVDTHFTNYYKDKVKDEIHKTGKGAAYSEAITAIRKKAGLTTAEVEGKKFEEIVDLLSEKITEKVGNKGAVEELNRLKQELIDAQNNLKKYDEDIIPALKSEKESAIAEYRKEQVIISEVNKHKLIGAPNYIVPSFVNDIKSKYKIDFDEQGKLIVTDKNGSKVYDDKKKELNLNEIVILEGKSAGIFAQSNGESQTQTKEAERKEDPNTPHLTGQAKERIAKARKHIEEMKAKAGIK